MKHVSCNDGLHYSNMLNGKSWMRSPAERILQALQSPYIKATVEFMEFELGLNVMFRINNERGLGKTKPSRFLEGFFRFYIKTHLENVGLQKFHLGWSLTAHSKAAFQFLDKTSCISTRSISRSELYTKNWSRKSWSGKFSPGNAPQPRLFGLIAHR